MRDGNWGCDGDAGWMWDDVAMAGEGGRLQARRCRRWWTEARLHRMTAWGDQGLTGPVHEPSCERPRAGLHHVIPFLVSNLGRCDRGAVRILHWHEQGLGNLGHRSDVLA